MTDQQDYPHSLSDDVGKTSYASKANSKQRSAVKKEERHYGGSSSIQRPMHVREVAANVGYLKLGDLVGQGGTADAELVRRLSRTLRFSTGQTIYPAKSTERLLIILEGTANLFLRYRGERTFVKHLEPGSIVGDMPLWGLRMLDTHAVATGHCQVRVLDETAAAELLRASPELHFRLRIVSGPSHHEVLGLYIDGFRPFDRRLVRFLLDEADDQGVVSGLRHADIAEILRAPHRETVSQAMRRLRQKGWIQSDRGRIKLIDLDALREFAS
jgi:CRP-like cAMP-binding protein